MTEMNVNVSDTRGAESLEIDKEGGMSSANHYGQSLESVGAAVAMVTITLSMAVVVAPLVTATVA